MSEVPTSFIRLRLFFAYSIVAWYSLYNPERALTMLKDYSAAEDKRRMNAARGRILGRRKKATCPGELG